MTTLWLGLAGGLGAIVRFMLDGVIARRIAHEVPIGTIVVNVSGSLVFGLLAGLVVFAGKPDAVRTIGGTGFCGGYTTFSTVSFETVRLLQRQRYRHALVSGVGTLLLSLAAAGLGLAIAAQM